MAENNKNTGEQAQEMAEEKKQAKLKSYEKLIDRLKDERKGLQNELDRDYREARRFVRSHPEEGVLIAFFGGITLGFLLAKISRK